MLSHHPPARHFTLFIVAASLCLSACGDDENAVSPPADAETGDATPGELIIPDTYSFESAFAPGESSVNYAGQTARHVLLKDLIATIGGLTASIDSETFSANAEGDVIALLDYYFRFDGDSYGEETFLLATTPSTLQSTWNDIADGRQLVDKIAGNDSSTDHVDWTTDFQGWTDASIAQHGGDITYPEGLVIAFFETIEANAIARTNGETRQGPGGEDLPVYVTANGLDLQQLTEKFINGALAFSQGADDYLDDDVDGKGLLADNLVQDGTDFWTALEHQWDEGFGYFGASRDYGDYTDDEIAAAGGRPEYASGYHDTNGDGAIDLTSEYIFGASSNAAKRDRGADATAPTDLTEQAFDAFVRGRTIITNAVGREFTDAEFAALVEQRDLAVEAWEMALAATAIHYVNETLSDMERFGTANYSFLDHAKHWSELKGFALGLQFNPDSPVTDEQFVELHALLGDAPVLATATEAEIEACRANLLAARTLLGDAYGFGSATVENW
ncbi:MAG: DUF4856 domain-containing protein [Myxococcales bacterium]|nr:DUF4856 domain-containing protein [Myxococcales bacterium]